MDTIDKFNMWATYYDYTTNLLQILVIFSFGGFYSPSQMGPKRLLEQFKIGLLNQFPLVFGQK